MLIYVSLITSDQQHELPFSLIKLAETIGGKEKNLNNVKLLCGSSIGGLRLLKKLPSVFS